MRRLFLIDGIGAFVSAVMLGLVLTAWMPVFGMPRRVLIPLALVAAGFAIYSLTCSVRADDPKFLFAIAIANTLYCVVTLSLVYVFRKPLTWLGIAYFLGEVLVIIGLVVAEVRAVRRLRAVRHSRPE